MQGLYKMIQKYFFRYVSNILHCIIYATRIFSGSIYGEDKASELKSCNHKIFICVSISTTLLIHSEDVKILKIIQK